MKLTGILASCALAGVLVLGSGADARPAGGDEQGTAVPMGTAGPTGGTGNVNKAPAPGALEAAESILAEQEAAMGRKYDPAYRAQMLNTLASKSTSELTAITSAGIASEQGFLGSNFEDYVYTPVSPCRIIDTRIAGGPIAAGTSRNFYAAGSNYSGQGGFAGSCGIPVGAAKAVVINFVATGGTAPGNLGYAPYPEGFTSTAIINWNATTASAIANGLTVAICNNYLNLCTYDFSIQARNNTTHVVADIQGYFAPPFATSLDVVSTYGNYFLCARLSDCTVWQTCAAGYTVTGGGCQLSATSFNWYWANNSPAGGLANTWYCQGTNTSDLGQFVRAVAMCSRVPGR